MNPKVLKIFVIALTTLFLSTPAFACGGVQKDKDIGKTGQDKLSMNNSDQSYSTDQDSGRLDQGNKDQDIPDQDTLGQDSLDNSKSMDRPDQSKTDQFDTSPEGESNSSY